MAKVTKYRNKKTVLDNITFDSKAEAARYQDLRLMERLGEISNLQIQVPYVVIPKQSGERAAKYVADFVYEKGGEMVVEDAKGKKTKDYILKRKLMLFVHGIKVKETGKR